MAKSVLVTGASKGIGAAIAQRLAADGYDVVVHFGGDEEGAAETLSAIQKEGADGRLLSFDISDRDQCKATLEKDITDNGTYWGIVLNAGISRDDAFPNLDGDDWDNVLRTNLDGFYNVLHPLVMPLVRARSGGRIVAMTSVSGEIGNRGQVNYSASKAGIIGAAKALALELAKRQITVNCVSPGVIETQMTDELPLKELKSMIPMRRLGRPEEVAALVSFLVSEQSSYITRQVFSVNGGLA